MLSVCFNYARGYIIIDYYSRNGKTNCLSLISQYNDKTSLLHKVIIAINNDFIKQNILMSRNWEFQFVKCLFNNFTVECWHFGRTQLLPIFSESCQREIETTDIDWDRDDDVMKKKTFVITFNVQYITKKVINFVKIE